MSPGDTFVSSILLLFSINSDHYSLIHSLILKVIDPLGLATTIVNHLYIPLDSTKDVAFLFFPFVVVFFLDYS